MTDVPSTGARAEVYDRKVLISISVDALPGILLGSCGLGAVRGLWKVTDPAEFAKEVCLALNEESENGTTRIHRMFDGAFSHVIEQGGEGVDACSEAEFETLIGMT